MPRMRPSSEKPKNFSKAVIRLFKNLGSFRFLICIALLLATLSSILSLIAPNKLSDFADEIQKGLIPNTDKFTEISKEMSNNFTDYNKLQEKLFKIDSDSSIDPKDKEEFMIILSNINKDSNKEESIKEIANIDESILIKLFDPIKIDGVTISSKDQAKMIKISSRMDTKNTSKNMELIDELPESVYSLIEGKINKSRVNEIIITLAIIYFLSALFGYIQALSMTTISNGFAKKLRSSISDKINKLPLKFFDTHENGDILSRVTNDVDSINMNLNNSLASLVSNLTLFLGSIIMMFITNWVMAVTAILSTIIGFILMFFITSKSQKYFDDNQRVLGELSGYIEEMYSGHNVVRAYNGTNDAKKEFSKLNKELYKAKRNSIFLSGTMQPIMGFVGNFGYVCVCVVGALLTMNGYITFGVIVAFMVYIRLFTNPLSQIAQCITSLQSIAAASERVFDFLDEEEMKKEDFDTHLHRHKVKGNIEFKDVCFSYDKKNPTIKNFNAKALPGQKIAIVGPTGAGKTTMVNLLMKFYDIDSGEILIDGVSTKDLTRENIHKLFVMVLQDTWLFDGTVRDNIKFNQKNVTDKEIWDVCEKVGIDHFIKTLPGGLDANVSSNEAISSGEKQLLTIARGMVEDAPFLILDEATSNVDTRTEELVQNAMDKLCVGRTSFIIAHRLSTIKNADLILVMDNGNIIETGNHEELMKKKGFYADLYNSQFEL